MIRRRRHDNPVKRRLVLPAEIPVVRSLLNPLVTRPPQIRLRPPGQRRNNLHAIDLGAHLRQHRRLVARTGPNLQHPVPGEIPSASVIIATISGCEIVCPSPIGSGRFSYASSTFSGRTNRCRSTRSTASSTGSEIPRSDARISAMSFERRSANTPSSRSSAPGVPLPDSPHPTTSKTTASTAHRTNQAPARIIRRPTSPSRAIARDHHLATRSLSQAATNQSHPLSRTLPRRPSPYRHGLRCASRPIHPAPATPPSTMQQGGCSLTTDSLSPDRRGTGIPVAEEPPMDPTPIVLTIVSVGAAMLVTFVGVAFRLGRSAGQDSRASRGHPPTSPGCPRVVRSRRRIDRTRFPHRRRHRRRPLQPRLSVRLTPAQPHPPAPPCPPRLGGSFSLSRWERAGVRGLPRTQPSRASSSWRAPLFTLSEGRGRTCPGLDPGFGRLRRKSVRGLPVVVAPAHNNRKGGDTASA